MIDGVLVVDKAAGWTSHDVVAKCRGILGQRRVGHAGTLDPDATGVLVLGLGRMTRLLRFVTELPKSYTGEVVLGVATSTLDASGDVTGTWDMSGISLDAVRAAAARFVGEVEQVPPMVSAVQVGGKRLHQLAREGVEVQRAPRSVTVHELTIDAAADGGVYRLAVRCSSGTYVRTLAADLGAALGGGAHLRSLRRTAVGSLTVEDAVPIDSVDKRHVLRPATALRDYEAVTVDDVTATAVGHGKVLEREALGSPVGPGPWPILARSGELLAVYEPHHADTAKPAVVLPR